MNKLALLIASLAIWSTAFAVLPDAIETEQSSQETLIIEHKLSLIDEQIDDERYEREQNERVANARHANEFIKKNRGEL